MKLHRDGHVVFENAYYSAPFRLIGQQLRVRGGTHQVCLYTVDYQLVATHQRARKPGQRQTHPAHLLPEKLPGLLLDRATCQAAASDIGSATAQVIQGLLDDPIVDRLPTARRWLKLRERFGDERLEAACGRALRFDDPSYPTIKRILEAGLEAEAPPVVTALPPARTFVRGATELLGHLFGGLVWH